MTLIRLGHCVGVITAILLSMQLQTSTAFATPRQSTWKSNIRYTFRHQLSRDSLLGEENTFENNITTEETPQFILRGGPDDELSEQIWEDIQTGEPPKWIIVKELLGVNAFTYLLAVLIVISLTLNVTLGPGWLGQAIGVAGTGTFTDVSKEFPDAIDLSNADYLL